MGQGDFAGSGIHIAAEQAGVARGMMGRAKGTPGDQSLPGPKEADDAVDLGGLKGFFEGQRWQDGWEPFGEHRFAGAGGADEEDVVAAGGRDFERAFRGLLAFDLFEIERDAALGGDARCRR